MIINKVTEPLQNSKIQNSWNYLMNSLNVCFSFLFRWDKIEKPFKICLLELDIFFFLFFTEFKTLKSNPLKNRPIICLHYYDTFMRYFKFVCILFDRLRWNVYLVPSFNEFFDVWLFKLGICTLWLFFYKVLFISWCKKKTKNQGSRFAMECLPCA